jgi:ADP-ribosylglycohydrolase
MAGVATADPHRIRAAWQGRVTGCQLGKPVELVSLLEGRDALLQYLEAADALPLRDYVPLVAGSSAITVGRSSCRDQLCRSEPDDDINYTVLALLMLEEHGSALTTEDVARAWFQRLPVGGTWTAERHAYLALAARVPAAFGVGAPAGFDVRECADNPFSTWIGAQIRADLYGWVCPGRPELAADLARRDAQLSHAGDGVEGAAFVAALGALIPTMSSLEDAVDAAVGLVAPGDAADAVRFGREHAGRSDGLAQILERYRELSPVHTVNNLAIVVWGLLSGADDFGRVVGDTVAAGWDTDCNGATVGGLWGLHHGTIPSAWTEPWQGRVAVELAGVGELDIDDLVSRTCAVADRLSM